MESHNKNTNYGQGEQQLRKRTFNELANDGQPAAAEGEGQQHQPLEKLSKMNCGEQQGNDDFENLDLESLTREELIQFFQKQLANQNEAHNKQLEAVKREAEDNAKKQAKETTTKVVKFNKALMGSKEKVEELTEEMTNLHVEYRKQIEELSQRISQLQQEFQQHNKNNRQ